MGLYVSLTRAHIAEGSTSTGRALAIATAVFPQQFVLLAGMNGSHCMTPSSMYGLDILLGAMLASYLHVQNKSNMHIVQLLLCQARLQGVTPKPGL